MPRKRPEAVTPLLSLTFGFRARRWPPPPGLSGLRRSRGGSFIASTITVVERVVRDPKPDAYPYPGGDTSGGVVHGYAHGRSEHSTYCHAHAHRPRFGHLGPLRAARARGFAVVLRITAFFGAWWGLVGASALLDGPSLPATLVVVAVTLLLAAVRLFRLSRRSPNSPADAGSNPFKARAYRLAVLFEGSSVSSGDAVLEYEGQSGLFGVFR